VNFKSRRLGNRYLEVRLPVVPERNGRNAMRALLLSLVLGLGALGLVAATPSSASADPHHGNRGWHGYRGGRPSWHGGSYYRWRGGNYYYPRYGGYFTPPAVGGYYSPGYYGVYSYPGYYGYGGGNYAPGVLGFQP
jgi:hypothetical protein